MKKQISLLICALLLLSGNMLNAQTLAFPGAEGFGRYATGGRGGKVMRVTNLSDAGSGSLRAAIESSGARTVVFEVSGTIELLSVLRITNGNITIAGQTAPGDGICIKNYTLTIDADNVIIRYIRCRLGDEYDQENDAMNGRYNTNVIIDHCSMSWSVDECATYYDNEDFTLQWCIISESLYNSVHEKGQHGYGGIWGGKGATFHHNLLAHHSSRNPRFNGARYHEDFDAERVDHRNNVIYNWGGNSAYGGEGGYINIVNNYYKYGPATTFSIRNRIVDPDRLTDSDDSDNLVFGMYAYYYVDGNFVYGYSKITADNWDGGVQGLTAAAVDTVKLDNPFSSPSAPDITLHTAEEAYEHVLAYAGAVLPKRDSVDERIIEETRTGTVNYGGIYGGGGKGIIDTPSDVGGWPVLNSTTAPTDTDHDGMPDSWESANGLDPNVATDRNDDADGDGYTNLEEYINSLIEDFEYVVRPINLSVSLADNNVIELSWNDISDNETSFVIERYGTDSFEQLAVVDANTTSYLDTVSSVSIYSYRIKAIKDEISSFYTDSLGIDMTTYTPNLIAGLKMKLDCYPNPFTGSVNIKFNLDRQEKIKISVYDITGVHLTDIVDQRLSAGTYNISWDGSAQSGKELDAGIYIVTVLLDNQITSQRIIKQ